VTPAGEPLRQSAPAISKYLKPSLGVTLSTWPELTLPDSDSACSTVSAFMPGSLSGAPGDAVPGAASSAQALPSERAAASAARRASVGERKDCMGLHGPGAPTFARDPAGPLVYTM